MKRLLAILAVLIVGGPAYAQETVAIERSEEFVQLTVDVAAPVSFVIAAFFVGLTAGALIAVGVPREVIEKLPPDAYASIVVGWVAVTVSVFFGWLALVAVLFVFFLFKSGRSRSQESVAPIGVKPDGATPATSRVVVPNPVAANPVTSNPATSNPVTSIPLTANPVATNPLTANQPTAPTPKSSRPPERRPPEPAGVSPLRPQESLDDLDIVLDTELDLDEQVILDDDDDEITIPTIDIR